VAKAFVAVAGALIVNVVGAVDGLRVWWCFYRVKRFLQGGGAAIALAICGGWSNTALAQKVPVTEHTLPNGMRMLLVERHDDPTIAGGWVAHVGSANERPGITGIAHLFEHMMFKGTPTIGTKDYKKDVEIIAEQELVRSEMRKEETRMRQAWREGKLDDLSKPENKSDRYKELEKKFNELIAKQREILVKNEFDRIYTTAGGSGMNAFTTSDITGYFITVPANKLELWMWMESERLLRPVFREFYAERDVVFEERRMRTDSTPLGKFAEAFEAMVWDSHPYGWPTVGWPSDIPAITKAQADEFYGLYYAPQNLSLILVGDFQSGQATNLAAQYFGRIPKGKADAPEVITSEIDQPAEKRMYGEAEANPQVDIVWHTVPFGHGESYALSLLSQVLSTRTGRLYKGLVLGSKVATDVSAYPNHRKWAGTFGISGEASEGRTPEEVERAIYQELDRLKAEDVPPEELQKVKNNFAAYEYRRLTSNMSILMQLIFNDGLGDWREINEAGPKQQAVTAADIRRVANKYLTKDNRNVAIYTRKGATSDPKETAAK
jgi:predicted Zn-dependent peptidase